jgi:hypothetical protein
LFAVLLMQRVLRAVSSDDPSMAASVLRGRV